jgi:CHAT domain-containing protein
MLASPAYPDELKLPFTPAEDEWVSRHFANAGKPVKLITNQATTLNILEALKTAGYFHFNGHAFYDWNNPWNSSLMCLGGEKTQYLTVQELMKTSSLDHLELVVMSACASGLTEFSRSGEEFIGLPGALLQTGVPAVVASLWPVHDLSTAFLMDEFYRIHLEEKKPVAQALREAALWLRGATRKQLYRRLEESFTEPRERARLKSMLDKSIAGRIRIPFETAEDVIKGLNSTTKDQPFANPRYWAVFAAYGDALTKSNEENV